MNKWKHISVNEFEQCRDQSLLVDIRDLNSYNQGHIPGAVNLNNDNLQNYISEQDFEKPLVVVCYVGNSSQGAADFMAGAGFETVYSLDGGMAQWRTQFPELIAFD